MRGTLTLSYLNTETLIVMSDFNGLLMHATGAVPLGDACCGSLHYRKTSLSFSKSAGETPSHFMPNPLLRVIVQTQCPPRGQDCSAGPP